MTIGTNILIAALMMGLASDLLFHDSIVHSVPNGLSVLLWSILTSLVVFTVAAAKRHDINRRNLWWLLPINLSAFAYMWRDSAILHGIDMYLMFFSLVMLSFSFKGNVAQATGVFNYVGAAFSTLIDSLVEAINLIKFDLPWREFIPQQLRGKAPAVVRGFAFAVPLLVIFSALFISADAAFASLLNRGLSINFSDVAVHSIILLGFSWCTAGYLRPMFSNDKGAELTANSDATIGMFKPNIGRVELNIVLALMNLLFLSFVLVQFRYFFGGTHLVMTTAHLTWSEYARKGFFELATVTGLVLPLLLAGDWLLPRHGDKFDKIFPIQAGIQISLLFIIMMSAFQRMNLYQQSFGQTELRFYVSAFIGCMAVLYLIFAATVLVGKRSKFAFAASCAAFVVVAILQVANPDRIIVAANIENAVKGKSFDSEYALRLSNDAVPYLAAHVKELPFTAQKEIARSLVSQEKNAKHYDIRSFNMSRCEAYNAIRENLPLLNAINTVGSIPDPATH